MDTRTSFVSDMGRDRVLGDAELTSKLRGMLELVKLQDGFPLTTAASALARATSQIIALSSILEGSSEAPEERTICLEDWCAFLFASLCLGKVDHDCLRFTTSGPEGRIAPAIAQGLGLVLGELVAEAIDRASRRDCAALIDIELASVGDGSYRILVRDAVASRGHPEIALLLADACGMTLNDRCCAEGTERELLFEAAS